MYSKFSLAEMTSNSMGKTSASGTMGIIICTTGTLCFLLGCLDKIFLTHEIDVITQSIIFVGIGASMLTYSKSQEKLLKDIITTQISANSKNTEKSNVNETDEDDYSTEVNETPANVPSVTNALPILDERK